MRILDRYILAMFIRNYAISFGVLIGLYIVMDMVFNFDEFVVTEQEAEGNPILATLTAIGEYYFYQSFMIFGQLAGIIPVVAAAFTLLRLSRFNETVAVMAAGVPLLRLAAPIIVASVILNLVLLPVNQELLIPQIRTELTRDRGKELVTGVTIEAMRVKDNDLLFAAEYRPATEQTPPTILRLTVVERDEAGRRTAQVVAEEAVWNEAEARWYLRDGLRIGAAGSPEQRQLPETVLATYDGGTPEQIALFESDQYVEFLSTARINEMLAADLSYGAPALLREKHFRLSRLVLNIVLVLLAIPTVLVRDPGQLKSASFLCLGMVGGAMGTAFMGQIMAGTPPPSFLAGDFWQQSWPAVVSWMPIFLYGPVAVVMLDRVKS
ncbi:MAG: LptF/LptG family permease [Phycisphaerae bacterium]